MVIKLKEGKIMAYTKEYYLKNKEEIIRKRKYMS